MGYKGSADSVGILVARLPFPAGLGTRVPVVLPSWIDHSPWGPCPLPERPGRPRPPEFLRARRSPSWRCLVERYFPLLRSRPVSPAPLHPAHALGLGHKGLLLFLGRERIGQFNHSSADHSFGFCGLSAAIAIFRSPEARLLPQEGLLLGLGGRNGGLRRRGAGPDQLRRTGRGRRTVGRGRGIDGGRGRKTPRAGFGRGGPSLSPEGGSIFGPSRYGESDGCPTMGGDGAGVANSTFGGTNTAPRSRSALRPRSTSGSRSIGSRGLPEPLVDPVPERRSASVKALNSPGQCVGRAFRPRLTGHHQSDSEPEKPRSHVAEDRVPGPTTP